MRAATGVLAQFQVTLTRRNELQLCQVQAKANLALAKVPSQQERLLFQLRTLRLPAQHHEFLVPHNMTQRCNTHHASLHLSKNLPIGSSDGVAASLSKAVDAFFLGTSVTVACMLLGAGTATVPLSDGSAAAPLGEAAACAAFRRLWGTLLALIMSEHGVAPLPCR